MQIEHYRIAQGSAPGTFIFVTEDEETGEVIDWTADPDFPVDAVKFEWKLNGTGGGLLDCDLSASGLGIGQIAWTSTPTQFVDPGILEGTLYCYSGSDRRPAAMVEVVVFAPLGAS